MVTQATPHTAGRSPALVKALIALCAILALSALTACSDPPADQGLPATTSLVIPVFEDGFHRLAIDALAGAGLDTNHLQERSTEPFLPRLSRNGLSVPLLRLDDSFIFYGQASSSRYAAYQPYVLETTDPGLKMRTEDRAPSRLVADSTAPFSLTFEENNFYDGRPYQGLPADPALRDPWYWHTIQVESLVSVEFNLPRRPLGGAILQLDLVGVSSSRQVADDHDLDVVLNGRRLQTVRWDGEAIANLPVEVPAGLLQQGQNTLLLDNTAPGAAPIDIVRLDRFHIDFTADARAIDGRLDSQSVAGPLALTGFQEQPLLFDISQPEAPIFLSGAVYEGDQLTIDLADPTKLSAVEPAALLPPQALWARDLTGMRNSARRADLLIIAPDLFAPALGPLVDHRRDQGLAVEVVSLERIYQEFAAQGAGPAAIAAFISHAYHNWKPPKPAYLLLVGDATLDYRNYSAQDLPPLLPSPVVPVSYSGETVSDARLADVDGDSRPDLAVGRWPVRSVEDVAALVRRTIGNEQAEPSSTAIFAADGSESRFASLNLAIAQQAGLPQDDLLSLDGPGNQELAQAWAQGAWLMTYTGHGSLDRWGKETLLDTASVSGLETATAQPFVLQLTCLTGLFAHPTITSLSEQMLLDDNGPIAIVAATSLSLSENQRPFGVALLQALQDPAIVRVGDAFQYAKMQLDIESHVALREISDTFTLFADPASPIRRPGQR